MASNKNTLKNIILEELQKVILNEARFVVKKKKQSSTEPKLSPEEEMMKTAAGANNMSYPLEINGKKYIYHKVATGVNLFDADEKFVNYWKSSGRTEKPLSVFMSFSELQSKYTPQDWIKVKNQLGIKDKK